MYDRYCLPEGELNLELERYQEQIKESLFKKTKGGKTMKLFLGRAEHLRDLRKKYGPESLFGEVIDQEMRYAEYYRSLQPGSYSNKRRRNKTNWTRTGP